MAFVPAPGYQSVYNPPVPFTTPISGGMRPGMGFAIKATTTRDSNRFAMNFTTCEGDDSDMALHMQARYDGRDRVVFNSRKGGQWMTEEMKKDMPFKLGKVFEILVQITPNNYLIFANGERFYEFAHRIPIDQVQWLNVSGDVTVQHMAILGCGTGVKGGLVLTAAQANLIPMMGPPALLPPVPFKAFINGGMIPKRSVVVKGTPNGKSFSINLKSGYNGDIAFHLNPRMNKGTVVRNTFINNAWGKEELDITKNPFKQGESFEVDIRSAENKYKVFINGSHGFDFAYRTLNLAQVDTVEVTGDVKIDYVFF